MVLAASHTFHLELFGSKTAKLLSFHICGIEVLTSKGVWFWILAALWFQHYGL